MNSASSSSEDNHHSPPLLSALAIFRNILNPELIRSVHAYRAAEGEKREEWSVRREFLFSPASCLEIRAPAPDSPSPARFEEGQMDGLWRCILAFDSDSPLPSPIPPILTFSRNPRLKSIPTLARDLQKVFQLISRRENEEPVILASEEVPLEKEDELSISGEFMPNLYEDQCSHDCPVIKPRIGENQQNNQHRPGVFLRKRAPTKHVASIALSDLSKYFNLPITEASRNLKVGVTVLKRKCREFGIPRWPHRKIKSLDTLIHDVQEEVNRQQKDNQAAAVKAATRRQKMLESEKEGIERSPFMELQRETRRFRQDVFKRRHRAKALSKKSQQS